MNRKFLKILAIYLVIMVSANVIHPITPEFIRVRMFPDFMFGVALAMMNLTNFLFSGFWGHICDKKGRLKVMMIGCSGYAIGQLGFGFSSSILTLILARLVAGFFTGAFTIPILAYISDISKPEEMKKHFSIFITSTAVASALGYYLGGLIGSMQLIYAFYLQVALLCLAILSIFFFVKEERSYHQPLQLNLLIKAMNPMQSFTKNKLNQTVLLMLGVSFFVYFANVMFDNSFSYYLSAQLKLRPIVNGVIKASTGLTTLAINLFIINRLVKKIAVNQIIKNILMLSITVLIGIIFSLNKEMFFGFSILFYIVFLCVIPLQQSLIMENIDEKMRGSASGMINAVRSIAGVIASLVAGAVYGRLPEIRLPYANVRIAFPVLISIVCLTIAVMMVIIFNNRRKKYDK